LSLDTLNDYYLRKKLKTEYLYHYVHKNPDSYVALWELSTQLEGGYNRQLDSAFEVLTDKIKSSTTGRLIVNNLKHQALTDTGKIFPSILLVDLEGKTQHLSYDTLKTKYLLIDFWFSHCGPCLSEFPEYLKITSEYQNKGFAMIGISSDSSQGDIEAWKKVILSKSLNWLQYRTDEATINNLDINWFPWNFLLDRSGKIIAKNLDTKQLSEFLQSNLN
jgi:thiol-disulfide isomerase/thioredoxin